MNMNKPSYMRMNAKKKLYEIIKFNDKIIWSKYLTSLILFYSFDSKSQKLNIKYVAVLLKF